MKRLFVLEACVFSFLVAGCTASQLNSVALGLSAMQLGANIHYSERALQVAAQPKTYYVHHIDDTPRVQLPSSIANNQGGTPPPVTPEMEAAMTTAAISGTPTDQQDKASGLENELARLEKLKDEGKITDREERNLRKKAIARY